MISFGSDNHSGFHPNVLKWLEKVNRGHSVAYGLDEYTNQAHGVFRDIFGPEVQIEFVLTGTGANVVALGSVCRSYEGVICAVGSHINVDECGSPEKLAGVKLLTVSTPDGKLRPKDLIPFGCYLGVEHHIQPRMVSITQPTEVGTLYSLDELYQLTSTAHEMGLLVHMDGARLANAVAALEVEPKAMTREVGVDILTLGGTKNGLICAESVVFLQPCLASNAKYVRKQSAQLMSKMRFMAAQYLAWFEDGLWLEMASHANNMAELLGSRLQAVEGLELAQPVAVDSVFVYLNPVVADLLLKRGWFFHVWEPSLNMYRFMTAFDTQPEDVSEFVEAVKQAIKEV